MKLLNDQFVNGQQSYARGVGLRNIVEQVMTETDAGRDAEGMSLMFGYLDGVIASIRRIDNLLMQGSPK